MEDVSVDNMLYNESVSGIRTGRNLPEDLESKNGLIDQRMFEKL